MLKRNEKSIGELLNEYLKLSQLDNVVFADQIGKIWQETLGDEIAQETERIFLHNGYLFIHLKSPSLKTEILMQRSRIAQLINEKLGCDIIKSVVVR